MNIRLLLLVAFVLAAPSARAQVVFTSPLPFGILQVHGDHADLRLRVAVQGYANFSIKLGSDIDTSSPVEGWSSVSIHNDTVDTILTVPKSLRDYSLYWRTGLSATDTGGIVSGLTPGHIIGIAGQSNAVGWVWPPPGEFVAVAKGDVRMLTNDSSWQHAEEPTDGIAQGPWIEMANCISSALQDSLPVGLVNTAVGSSGLTISVGGKGRWIKGSSNRSDSMYPNAVNRFRYAGSELECFAWIQGEADGEGDALWNPDMYRSQFATLIQDFEEDLSDTFPVFHLQISGYSGHLANPETYPQAREALRVLPPSNLVGTAIGRPLWDSAFHYTVSTYRTVGRMFAAAILNKMYGIDSSLYPPLLPDTVATLDSITDGSIIGHYCFAINWTRNGQPVPLLSVHPDQYFTLQKDFLPLDTSKVWYRISSDQPNQVLVGLRNDSITLDHDWRLIYDAVGSGEYAPLATIDNSRDTIFATAFYDLPIHYNLSEPATVSAFTVKSVLPNPTTNSLSCYVLVFKHQIIKVDLLNSLGSSIRNQSAVLEEGLQDLSLPTDGLPSGTYWIELRDEEGNATLQKAVLVH